MTKTYILSFVIAHLLGDFYWQTATLAETKKGNYKETFKHCCIYALALCVVAIVLFLYCNESLSFVMAGILGISHLLIDMVKCYLEKTQRIEWLIFNHSLKNNKLTSDRKINLERTSLISAKLKEQVQRYRYIIDQLLHIGTNVMIGLWLFPQTTELTKEEMNIQLIVQVITYWLILMKPTNITFKVLFSAYQTASIKLAEMVTGDQEVSTVKGAGALIGSLERTIIGIFIYLNQFASIALILTAKTITRYNKIVTDPGFSEYYLIGTLYSILVPLVSYGVIFKL